MAHDHFTLDGCEAPLPGGEGRMPTSPLAPVSVKWS